MGLMKIDLGDLTEAPDGFAPTVRKFDHKAERCVYGVVTGVNGYLETTQDGGTKGSYSLSVNGWLASTRNEEEPQEYRVYVTADIKHRLCRMLGCTLSEFESITDDGWTACEPIVGDGLLFYFVGPESDAPNARHVFQLAWNDKYLNTEDGPSPLEAMRSRGRRIVEMSLASDPTCMDPWDPGAGSEVFRDLDAPL